MNKSDFYNKFERYLQNKNMNNGFMSKTDLYNKMNEYFTTKYIKKRGDEYHLIISGKILVFKKVKNITKNGGVKC